VIVALCGCVSIAAFWVKPRTATNRQSKSSGVYNVRTGKAVNGANQWRVAKCWYGKVMWGVGGATKRRKRRRTKCSEVGYVRLCAAA